MFVLLRQSLNSFLQYSFLEWSHYDTLQWWTMLEVTCLYSHGLNHDSRSFKCIMKKHIIFRECDHFSSKVIYNALSGTSGFTKQAGSRKRFVIRLVFIEVRSRQRRTRRTDAYLHLDSKNKMSFNLKFEQLLYSEIKRAKQSRCGEAWCNVWHLKSVQAFFFNLLLLKYIQSIDLTVINYQSS